MLNLAPIDYEVKNLKVMGQTGCRDVITAQYYENPLFNIYQI
jgi:hypothetical protein